MKKNMKKIIGTIAFIAAMSPFVAFASTSVSLSTVSQQVSVGQQVTVTVSLAPIAKIYTSKVVLSYSGSLLTETRFTFGPTWIPVSQSGYDSIDAVTGVLTKTAG